MKKRYLNMQNLIVIHDAENKQWLRFKRPVKIIKTGDINEVISKFQQVEDTVNKEGLYAVGFISYEAASAFDSALQTKSLQSFPLLWFAFYKDYEIIDLLSEHSTSDYLKNWSSSVSRKKYDVAISKIKDHIREGDTYQVNYTMRENADFSGDAWKLFKELSHTQRADYSAFIDTEQFTVCSASPELFFTYNKGKLIGCPMKGTAGRGLTLENDKKQADWLYHSKKDRAENLMILDMIRNDFGRVAEAGSVKVAKLFSIEKYPTVWQMTSTVEAETKVGMTDIMKALFPCASITGAPKAYTMKIISELENTSRGIYTGSIGFMTPEKKAQFNVAIRTLVIDKTSNKAEYGVGGGIVWDSTDNGEYDECKIKTKVLTERQPCFSLLESILWTPEQGYFLLNYHLRRLSDSAEYFDFDIDIKQIELSLIAKMCHFPKKPQKVRLLISRKGEITCQFEDLTDNLRKDTVIKVAIADKPINISNPFLYHKTTNRAVYNSFKEKFPDYDNVLLWNDKKEITELCTANIVINLNGVLYTPPVQSGLLSGTFRQHLLEQGTINEKTIHLDDLKKAEELFLINSVRMWQRMKISK